MTLREKILKKNFILTKTKLLSIVKKLINFVDNVNLCIYHEIYVILYLNFLSFLIKSQKNINHKENRNENQI